MATALEGVTKLEVQSLIWAPNQARTLEAFHCIPFDSGASLSIGTEVTYTDTDLGLIFIGKIVDRKKQFRDGEGFLYTCADVYRTLAKSPAKVLFNTFASAKIQITDGTTLSDAITLILSEYTSLFPGGITNSIPDVTLPKLDKGGQDVDSWLDDLLDFTDGGIAYVDPTSGSPKLIIEDFFSAAAVSLTIGTFTVINPASGELVVQDGSAGESINKKYEKYTIEGAGQFTRHIEIHTVGEAIRLIDGLPLFQMKFYVNNLHKRILKRFVNSDGTCADGFGMKVRIGSVNSSGKFEVTINNPQLARDLNGDLFFWIIISIGGASLSGDFIAPQTAAWLTYTSYDGPFPVTVEDAAVALDDEGEFYEMHCEFFKYTSIDGDFDGTAAATTLAEQLHTRYAGIDQTGDIVVHVEGLNASLKLGSSITNFAGMRVRDIAYNFVDRSIALTMSSLPLRDQISQRKQLKKNISLERNDWFASKGEGEGCFCGLETLLNEDGIPVDPDPLADLPGNVGSGDDGGGDVSTYDCQFGDCIEVDGTNGQYETLDDCERVCAITGAKFVPCLGCMNVEDLNAPFVDIDECIAANPDPLAGCKYDCTGPHNNAPTWRCKPDLNGKYDTLGECETACEAPAGEPGGSGVGGDEGTGEPSSGAESGPPFPGSGDDTPSGKCFDCLSGETTGVVDKIKVDKHGHIIEVRCTDVGAGCPEGSVTETITVVCDVECTNGNITIDFTTFTFEDGCLISCLSDCEGECTS